MEIRLIPFFSQISPKGLKGDILNQLSNIRGSLVDPDSFISNSSKYRPCLFIGTGGTENDVEDFLKNHHLPPPIMILSYDLRNSLPAAMEIHSYLQHKGIESRIVHAPLPELNRILEEWVEFSEIVSKVQSSTLGIVGKPSSWLIASKVNADKVYKRWGLTIKELSLDPLIESTRTTGESEHVAKLKQSSTSCTPSDDELAKVGRVAQALRNLVIEHNLEAVTVECFSLLMETNVSGCFALSLLNDISESTAGCEGDVPATFTMMLGKLLTGFPGFMSNVTKIDQEKNTAVFAHCTLPLSLVENYEITSHFETGLSIGIHGKFKRQPVTVFKVHGEDLRDYWVSDGNIQDNLVNDTGCRTQILVKLEESVDYFLERSLANHHIVIPGRHAARIHRFFSFI